MAVRRRPWEPTSEIQTTTAASDLIVTNFSEDTNTLSRNLGRGAYEDASWASKIGPPSWLFVGWGVKFLDYDNDGRLDVMVANGHVYPEADRFGGGSTYRQRILLHHNRGDGIFAEIGAAEPALASPGTARGLAIGDIDGDGRLDVLINRQDAAPRLLINRIPGGTGCGSRCAEPGAIATESARWSP